MRTTAIVCMLIYLAAMPFCIRYWAWPILKGIFWFWWFCLTHPRCVLSWLIIPLPLLIWHNCPWAILAFIVLSKVLLICGDHKGPGRRW